MYSYFNNIRDDFKDEFEKIHGNLSDKSNLLVVCMYKHVHNGTLDINNAADMARFQSIIAGLDDFTSEIVKMRNKKTCDALFNY